MLAVSVLAVPVSAGLSAPAAEGVFVKLKSGFVLGFIAETGALATE